MSLLKNLTFSKLTAVIGAIIGLVGASLTIYAFFFQKNEIKLRYEIIANSNVLDINAEITKLDILYNGNSLKEKDENLRIINLKIINTGSQHILSTYYDEKDPLGFEIQGGTVIESPEVLDASNEYLKNNLVVSVDSTNRIKFSKIILESNEFFIIKVLILHKSRMKPSIIPVGKIAGVKHINLINEIQVQEKRTFFTEVFEGGIFVQIVKGFSYFLITLLIILGVAFASDTISGFNQKHKRKKIIKEFLSESDRHFSRMDDAIFDRYTKEGNDFIEMVSDFVNNEKTLNDRYKKWIKKTRDHHQEEVDLEIPSEIIRVSHPRLLHFNIFSEMIKDGVLLKQKDGVAVNEPLKKTLNALVIFLKEKGELKTNFSRGTKRRTVKSRTNNRGSKNK